MAGVPQPGLRQDEAAPEAAPDRGRAQPLRPAKTGSFGIHLRQHRPPARMRVLVTGAAGFLGSHLVDKFLALGYDVLGMDNHITGNPANLEHLSAHPRFRFANQDVTRYIEVEGPLDAVLHFASPASPVDYLELPIQTLKVGALGTHKALGL